MRPRTVVRFSSAYNQDIHVVEVSEQYNLYVDGSSQSGMYIRRLWTTALTSFHLKRMKSPQNILICGVAGGTVIHLLHALYPEANMVGVDIDNEMIEVGRKYFGLSNISTLTLVKREARDYIGSFIQRKKTFDMIVIDLFIGRHVPDFLLKQTFWESVKKILRKDGILLLNYLREDTYLRKSDTVQGVLAKLFATVRDKTIYRNRFFFAIK